MKKLFSIVALVAVSVSLTFAQSAPAAKKKHAKKAKVTTSTPVMSASAAPAATSKAPVEIAGWNNSSAPAASPAPTNVAAEKASKAKMSFETDRIDYGSIKKGAEPLRQFKFKNTGTEPLVIKAAQGSCGCTVPTYPKEPIMPGASASIDVRYDTQRPGQFTKTVTLTTNAEGQESKVLTISGTVAAE